MGIRPPTSAIGGGQADPFPFCPVRRGLCQPVLASSTGVAGGAAFLFEHGQIGGEGRAELPVARHHFVCVLLEGGLDCDLACDEVSYKGRAGPGAVCVVPAGTTARWRWAGRGGTVMLVFLDPDWLGNHAAPGPAAGSLAAVQHREDPFLLHLASVVGDELAASTAAAPLMLEGAATVAGLHLLRRYGRDNLPDKPVASKGGLAGWQLRRVTAAMEAALGQPDGREALTLAGLAALVGLTPAHFCTAFRQSTGLPPRRWLMHHRTERAKAMLDDPALSLTEIALACGYGSSSHFSTTFRKQAGLTPSLYRRQL